ncbi:TetR family transcriptional regulator [Nocardioides caeni]|uniref:TetR/AcrR family transcriptional regulator n=1 Tax=Nocardioides caeni TaxID=574700 RepID=UPI0013051CE1|nr:TetR family transcriptional regulator [Nocardioides caeni]
MTKTSPPAPVDESRLRPAGRATRTAIVDAARSLFAERGFEAASVRAIAAEAGVDPAMVIRHFGSKEALFLRAIDTSIGIGAVLDGPLESLGRRLVSYFIESGPISRRGTYLALAQAAHHPQVRDEMVRITAEAYIAPLAPRLEGEHRELRVALLVAQVGGLLSMLYQQEDPSLTSAGTTAIVELYGDAMQQLLTP